MRPPDLEALAVDVAREAGALALRRRAEGVSIAATKSAIADIVTDADREVEALIRGRLARERPQDGFLGEESGGQRSTGDITWVVDPIDGTVNYAYGIPAWAVSIAAVSGEPAPETWQVLAGAVFNPASGELFHAHLGGGAWLGDTRLAVNVELTAAGALLGTGFGYDPATHAGDLARLARVMSAARDIRRIGAASLDIAFVAAGRLDGYYERGLNPWDHGAAELLIAEAGGVIGGGGDRRHGRAMTIAAGEPLYRTLSRLVREHQSEG